MHDAALLAAYPESTSAPDAAAAVARAVRAATDGALKPQVLDAAQRALAGLAKASDPEALPALVDAVCAGAGCVLENVFVLCVGAWRAVVAMRSRLKERSHVARLLTAAAQGAVAQLQMNGNAGKLARVARFHIGNGVRCALACPDARGDHCAEDEDACSATALSFGCVLATCSDPPTVAAAGALFEQALLRCEPAKWRPALVGSDAPDKSQAVWRAAAALYVSRWCVAEDADEKRLQWQEKCRAAACRVLDALCDLLQRHDSELLRHSPGEGPPSYAALLTSGIRDVALRFVDNSNVDEQLLQRIAGTSDLVYCAASHALVALCSSGRLNVAHIQAQLNCAHQLSLTVSSPQAEQRWAPLLKRTGATLAANATVSCALKGCSDSGEENVLGALVRAATAADSNSSEWAAKTALVAQHLDRL